MQSAMVVAVDGQLNSLSHITSVLEPSMTMTGGLAHSGTGWPIALHSMRALISESVPQIPPSGELSCG